MRAALTAVMLVGGFWFNPAAAQSVVAQPDSTPAAVPATNPASAQFETYAAALRAAWLKSGRVARDETSPIVTGGRVLTTQLSPNAAPAAPAVEFSFTTDESGVSLYQFVFSSALTGQYLVLSGSAGSPGYYGPPVTSGRRIVQKPAGELGSPAALGPYAAAGEWRLTDVGLYSNDGRSVFYSRAQIVALFAKPGFRVTNASADMTPPALSDGAILSPHVSLSAAYPTFRASVAASDDRSGVRYVEMTLQAPAQGGAQPQSYIASTNLQSPFMSGTLEIKAFLPTDAPAGTYTIVAYYACDIAGNCTSGETSADVIALFGADTVRVTR